MPKYTVTISYVLNSNRENPMLMYIANIKAMTERLAEQFALNYIEELVDDEIYEYDIINIDEEADNYVH